MEIENNLEKLGGMLHKQYKSVKEIQRISDFNIMENKKENKVQCLPGILSEDPALYYYEYMDTSKLNSNRSNTTQKEKNRR